MTSRSSSNNSAGEIAAAIDACFKVRQQRRQLLHPRIGLPQLSGGMARLPKVVSQLLQRLGFAHVSACTTFTGTPASRAILHIIAVPRDDGNGLSTNAHTTSGLPSSSICRLRM